jgi:hypothetical protein
MTVFTLDSIHGVKLAYITEFLPSSDYNWELTKSQLTLSSSDYERGFRVTVPISSDGEESFNLSAESTYAVFGSIRAGTFAFRIDFNTITAMDYSSGTNTQFYTKPFNTSHAILPSQWGPEYPISREVFDIQGPSRMSSTSAFLKSRPIVEFSHGNLYFGSATVPGLFTYKHKTVTEVPDFITSLSNTSALGWLAQTNLDAPISLQVTDTHVRSNVGDDFIYTARYNYTPHLMEKAILSVHLKSKLTVSVPTEEWISILPPEHDSLVTVHMEGHSLKLETSSVDGHFVDTESEREEGGHVTIVFGPTQLPTALGLLGKRPITLRVPESGRVVLLESDRAEVLIPATVIFGKGK